MTFEKSKSAGYLANHMARLFANGLHQRIRPLGLAPAQFMTLLELWEMDGQTQRQLVEKLDVEQATMANTLSRMERDGLIVRKANENDKRSRSICLTKKARTLRGPAIKAAMMQNRQALSGLSPEQQQQFLQMMEKVIEAMKPDQSP